MLNRNPVAARDHTVHALARLIQSICANHGTPISSRRNIFDHLARVALPEDNLQLNFASAYEHSKLLMRREKSSR